MKLIQNKKIFSAGALGISLVLHLVLLLLIGGVVLIEGVIPKTLFKDYELASDTDVGPIDEVVPEMEAGQPDAPALSEEQPSTSSNAVPLDNATSDNLLVTESISSFQTMSLPAPSASVSHEGKGSGVQGSGSGSGSGPKGMRSMTNLFGTKGASSDGLVGYFYDLKQTSDRKPTAMAGSPQEVRDIANPANVKFREVVKDFIKNWNPAVLKDFYRSPDPLTSFQFFMPSIDANAAPKAFDVEKEVQPKRWLVHYQGKVTAPRSGTFRFVGLGDDILFVRFNNKDVLDGSWLTYDKSFNDNETYGKAFASCNQDLRIGKWINVTAGQTYPMEVLIGEFPGGKFASFLMAEEKGVKYADRPQGVRGPRLPVFQTAATKMPPYNPEVDAPAVSEEGYLFAP